MKDETLVYIALGTNLGQLADNLSRAITLIGERVGTVTQCATPLHTQPVDFESVHPFLNSAIEVRTTLSIEQVLQHTQQIEQLMGRTLKSHDGIHYDRIIDIDLLFYGNTCVRTERITLPHPRLADRLFVLEPLAQIAPNLVHPHYQQTISELLAVRKRCSIERLALKHCTPQLLVPFNQLMQQLSASAPQLTLAQLQQLSAEHNPQSHIVLLYDEATPHTQPIGTATLCLCYQPTGCKAWIEDVVIDAAHRGKGLSRPLLQHLIALARSVGAQSVNLTSRPERVAANRLYQSLGFVLRSTNVYKLPL